MKGSERIDVPFIVYEGSLARMERTIKRLFVLLLVSVVICFLSNMIWLYWWNQYDYVSTTQTETYSYQQDGNGFNLIGDRNHINEPEIYEDENDQDSFTD